MKILANKDIRNLFLAVSVIWAASLLLAQGFLWLRYQRLSLCLLFIFLLAAAAIWVVCCSYFKKQNKIMEQAVSQINVYLDGDSNARIECDSEGELYRLFHSVNSLAAVLNAHADNELREKEFLKNTISDISHQLKTPLASLTVFLDLLYDGRVPDVDKQKQMLLESKNQVSRMEWMVLSMLKLARIEAGAIQFEKHPCSLYAIVAQAKESVAYLTEKRGQQIDVQIDEKQMLVCCSVLKIVSGSPSPTMQAFVSSSTTFAYALILFSFCYTFGKKIMLPTAAAALLSS